MTILMVVGVAAKIASIAAKTATFALKARAMAMVGFGLLNAMFNPLDGVPTLLHGGVKYLGKSVLAVGKAGINTLETATFKLRQLTGIQSYDLIKAADRMDIGQGIWRANDAAGESVMLLAIRQNDNWYALNRMGQPWRQRLENFAFTRVFTPSRLQKLMPAKYTRQIIQKSLPHSITKTNNAINVLNDPGLIDESNHVLRMLLGDDSINARNAYLEHLKSVNNDLVNTSASHFIIDTSNGSHAIASLNPGYYKAWKGAEKAEASNRQFIRLYKKNFDTHFKNENFNPAVIADDIIHELFHGKPDTFDVTYALDPQRYQKGYQNLNMVQLLNLGKGRHPIPADIIAKAKDLNTSDRFIKALNLTPSELGSGYFNKAQSIINADSYAISTSLLSQLATDKQGFLHNIVIMKAAVDRSGKYGIGPDVLIQLNRI
ncbi:hypothetical protein [Pseudomonas nunensis]|uniref:hypothetical protein n=1 Tax=Pseudomonas nunensis TaxID=2961896 RepID=UPI0025B16040|nr:hypothetical protein [Pseudomonas nunensis]MDN3221511.1 hypothetical protein [Pseudomonas nunensis]